VSVVQSMYGEAIVRVNGHDSKAFGVGVGVLQGSVLASRGSSLKVKGKLYRACIRNIVFQTCIITNIS